MPDLTPSEALQLLEGAAVQTVMFDCLGSVELDLYHPIRLRHAGYLRLGPLPEFVSSGITTPSSAANYAFQMHALIEQRVANIELSPLASLTVSFEGGSQLLLRPAGSTARKAYATIRRDDKSQVTLLGEAPTDPEIPTSLPDPALAVAYENLAGKTLTSLGFCMDYLMLGFEGYGISALVWPTINSSSARCTIGMEGYYDLLCWLIGAKALATAYEEDVELKILLDNTTELRFDLTPHGGERLLMGCPGGQLVVE